MNNIDIKDMIVEDALDIMSKLDEAVSLPAGEKSQPSLLRHRKRGRPKGFRLKESSRKGIELAKTGHVVTEETKKKISDGVKRVGSNTISLERILAADLDTATKFVTKGGYVNVYIPNLDGCGRGDCMRYHTALMEKTIGRKLKTDEDIHHIDFNKENNNIDNLIILNKKDHRKEHPYAKNYIITFPNGSVEEILNLYKFCVEHSLLYVAMCNIANNKKYYRSHHGFSCVKAGAL